MTVPSHLAQLKNKKKHVSEMLTHPDSAFQTTLLSHEEDLIERQGQAQPINTRSAHSR